MHTHHLLRCTVAAGAICVGAARLAAASQEPDPASQDGGEQEPDGQGPEVLEPEQEQAQAAERPMWPPLRVVAVDLEIDFSTKTARDFILAPSTISVIREAEFRWSGSRYPSDLLRLVPGLEVQRISATSSNVSVRSFNDNPTAAGGVLALIDGRRVYNEWLGNPLWDQLMLIPEDIQEVEVIRGPGSFLYGPNAMHGLVNFITKAPLDYADDQVSLLTSYGSPETTTNRLRYVKRDDEDGSGLIATLVYDDIDAFEAGDDQQMNKVYGEVRYQKDLGGGSSGGLEKSDNLLEIGAGISDQELDILIPTFLPPLPPDLYSNQVQETYVTGKYTDEGLVVQATWSGFDSQSEAEMYFEPFTLDLDTVDLDVHYSFELMEDHDLTVGGAYRYATYDSKDNDVSNGRNGAGLISAFIQDEVTLVDEELFLTTGVRVDEHTEAGSNAAPRAALVWRWDESHSVRASYGRGHRNPSLGENWRNLSGTFPFGTFTIQGNEDVEAEKLESYELGYRGWFDDDSLRVGATGYWNNIEDLIVLTQVSPTSVMPVNQDAQTAHGVELEAEYAFSSVLSGFGNYAYRLREETGNRIPNSPANTANLGLRYSTFPEKPTDPVLNAMAWATFFDDTTFPGGSVDEYTLLNASVSYSWGGRQSVFLKAFNLFDDVHRENPEGDEYGVILQVGFEIHF